ncbi:hypothetical protein EVAR_33584_1 [Eumeta japonica]|uniref:Uncharacterized protein n=1 Tax=Eumeta variegata TaxID=151549 RepID=A0A4C1VJS1_EUMVA|nr:hypothetical protein EVAR_33584_1 [Eumeta japonica]
MDRSTAEAPHSHRVQTGIIHSRCFFSSKECEFRWPTLFPLLHPPLHQPPRPPSKHLPLSDILFLLKRSSSWMLEPGGYL